MGAGAFALLQSSGQPRQHPQYIAAPGVRQARWKVTAGPAGAIGKAHRDDRRQIKSHSAELTSSIRRLFNAMFLYPDESAAVVKRLFSASAARALKSSGAGLPRGASNIQIVRRVAHLGVDISGPSRAAARIRVVAKGAVDADHFALRQDASLWLSRVDKDWKVIGFKIDQRPWHRAGPSRRPQERRDGKPAPRPHHPNKESTDSKRAERKTGAGNHPKHSQRDEER
jgi:hypothetical protein